MGDTDFPSLSLSPNQTFIAADADRGCASMMRSGREILKEVDYFSFPGSLIG